MASVKHRPRTLITRPRLLLLDEPTSALDTENAATVHGLLQEARARGTTMIGVFHDPRAVTELCDSVAVMQGGRLIAVQPVAAFNARALAESVAAGT